MHNVQEAGTVACARSTGNSRLPGHTVTVGNALRVREVLVLYRPAANVIYATTVAVMIIAGCVALLPTPHTHSLLCYDAGIACSHVCASALDAAATIMI